MKSFDDLLLFEVIRNIGNYYTDNYDYYRFGVRPKPNRTWKSKVKVFLKKKLRINDVYLDIENYQKSLKQLSPYMDGIRKLYTILADEHSKLLLIKLIAYRILGEEKLKLPLSTHNYWKGIKEIDRVKNMNDSIVVPYVGDRSITLYKFDLKQVNIPIQIYYGSSGIYNHLNIKQYEYISDDISIKPEAGNIVLDCGACWGDTALFFSNEVKNTGHIYSFEFVPGNIEIFNKNVNLNQHLKDHITLIPYALAETSGQELNYFDNGPGSNVTAPMSDNAPKAKSITIDDFFLKYKPGGIDFIKMDIEGAELQALRGGINIIRRFRPKLAISIYHSMDDFINIPEYLHSLDLGYSFYIKHGTIHQEETVLIAIVHRKLTSP